VPIEAFGRRIDPTTLVELDWPIPSVEDGVLEASIVYIDTFGNVKLGAAKGDLFDALGPLSFGVPLEAEIESSRGPVRTLEMPWLETFGRAEPRTTLLYEDSYSRLAIAENQGSAEVRHRLREGMTLRIRRADSRQAARDKAAERGEREAS
jgi:S-adenosylmethionine hydrolase